MRLPRPFPALLASVLALVSACAKHPQGDVLASVRFEGNDRPEGLDGVLPVNTDKALVNALSHPPPRTFSTWAPRWIPPTPLDRDTLDADAWRIEVWYADHGWFDARFVGWELEETPSALPWRRSLHPWTLTGHVAQGQPSRLRAVTIRGTEGLTAPLRARLQESVELAEGDLYDTLAWQEARDALRGILRDRGYAHARVDVGVNAFPDALAVDLDLHVTSGPACRFGTITLPNVRGVPMDAVRDALPLKEGQSYRASAVAAARDQLFALRAFSVVNVEPDLSDPTADIIPVKVTLRRGRTREVALGPELELETGKYAAYGTGSWKDDNALSKLWRASTGIRAGLASVTTVDELGNDALSTPAPVGDASLEVILPRVPGPGWTASVTSQAAFDVAPGRTYFQPEVSPALSWKANRRLSLTGSYRLRYFRLVEGNLDEIVNAPRGIDPNEPFFLSMIEQGVVYDGRNDPVQTTRGGMWSLQFAEAGKWLGGTYGFLRGSGEIRAYKSVTRILGWDPNLVLAGRLAGGGLLSAQGDDVLSVPVEERFYLGGGTTVRGWAADRLGPWETVRNTEGVDEVVPIGGLVTLSGNLEARKAIGYGFRAAGFVDAGRCWRTYAELLGGGVQVSVGGGLRYDSLIGPVRIDVARRLGNTPAFEFYSKWGIHFGLSEAF